MAADKDYLRQLAIAIRDEYRKGANTAYRVGSLLLSLIDTDANIESLSQYFIRKDKEDVAKEIITFLKGLVSNLVQSEGFSPGEFGSGFVLRNDEGGSYLEIDRLLVRRIAYFVELVIKSLKHVGGSLVLSPASMVCSKVEEYDAYYRCYFEHEREGRFIYQEFVPGDQARAQEFNVKEGVNQNVASRFYWRLVIAVGDNYIDLSKSDAAVGSVAPQAGDDIVMLGNRDDVTRQNAIILSTIGDDAPSIKQYKGINSYSTEGKEITIISSVLNSFTGRFKSSVTGKDFDAMLDEFNTDLNKIKAQTDQEYTIWFYEYEPTLENIPACEWSDQDKIDHEYDIFYYSEAGLAWRFVKGQWVPITDQQTLAALQKAKKAQDTADKVTERLDNIVKDGVLSALEKKEVLKEWQSVASAYKKNYTTALSFNLHMNPVFISYYNAFYNLLWYLNDGVQTLDDKTVPAWLRDPLLFVDTDIDADTYRSMWSSYYTNEATLTNFFAEEAGVRADRAQETADNKRRNFVSLPVPPYDKGDTWSNAVYPESGEEKGVIYNNDDLVCITSKPKDGVFSIDDWQPASDMNSDTKKVFMSKFDQLEDSIRLEVIARETLSGTVDTLSLSLDGAKGEISAIAALFDEDGHLKEGSGWATASDYATLFSQINTMDGKLSAKAEVKTSVQYDPQTGAVTSSIKLSADKISLEGITTINNSFSVDTDGTTRIGGFVVSGNGLTNRNEDDTFTNDAYVVFRNDDYNCFAGIGGNILPASSGLRAVARFENHDNSDWWGIGLNCAMLVSSQGSDENIAIRLDGGSVTCLALKTRQIGHESVTSSTKPASVSYTLDRHVGSVYVSTQFNWRSSSSGSYASNTRDTHITLPVMQSYDDGHVLKIKRGPNDGSKVYLYPNLMKYKTYGFTYAYELGTVFHDISRHNLPSGVDLPFSIDLNGVSSCYVWLLNSSNEILASALRTSDGVFKMRAVLPLNGTGSSIPTKLQIQNSGCVVSCYYSGMAYKSRIEVWGQSVILCDNSTYVTPSSPLQISSQGDAMELVYHRDLTVTLDSVEYRGFWLQYKHPRSW